MNVRGRVWAGSWAGSALLAAAAWGGPLDRAVVDRGAMWLAHLDCEALAAADSGRALLQDRAGTFSRSAARLQSNFGLDLAKDVRGMTFYGVPGLGGTVTVIETTAAADELGHHLEHADVVDLRHELEGGVEVYSWVNHGEATHATVRSGRTAGVRQIVLAGDREGLRRAMAVLDGVRESGTAGLDGALSAAPGPRSIFFAAVAGAGLKDVGQPRPEVPGDEPRRRGQPGPPMPGGPEAMIFRAAEELTIDLGELPGEHPEDGAQAYAKLWIRTADAEVGADCEAVVRGILAMGAISARDNPSMAPVARFVRGVSVERHEAEIRLWTQPKAETVVQLLNSLKRDDQALAAEPGERG